MPLTTDPSFPFREDGDVVRFEMADGEKKVSCSVTAQALKDLGNGTTFVTPTILKSFKPVVRKSRLLPVPSMTQANLLHVLLLIG